ncbi:hypothetical protein HK405_006483 [Cladochytrium tenue]|nr:hypothetical protein HK405_006483 [Cladochytrium tenue]
MDGDASKTNGAPTTKNYVIDVRGQVDSTKPTPGSSDTSPGLAFFPSWRPRRQPPHPARAMRTITKGLGGALYRSLGKSGGVVDRVTLVALLARLGRSAGTGHTRRQKAAFLFLAVGAIAALCWLGGFESWFEAVRSMGRSGGTAFRTDGAAVGAGLALSSVTSASSSTEPTASTKPTVDTEAIAFNLWPAPNRTGDSAFVDSRPNRKEYDEAGEEAYQSDLIKWWKREKLAALQLSPDNVFGNGQKSQGVVFACTTKKYLGNAIQSVIMMRRNGCSPDITMAFADPAINEEDTNKLKNFGITPMNLTLQVPSHWTRNELAIGGLKGLALSYALYDRVLLLEDGVVPATNICKIFDELDDPSATEHGQPSTSAPAAPVAALFWPGMSALSARNRLWSVLGLSAEDSLPEVETNGGAVLVDRRRAGAAVPLAELMHQEAAFYLNHTDDVFYWALRVTNVPFAIVRAYPEIVGVLSSTGRPKGGARLAAAEGVSSGGANSGPMLYSPPSDQPNFCGRGQVLADPHGIRRGDDDDNGRFGNIPFLVRTTGLKEDFDVGVQSFAVTIGYDAGGRHADLVSGRIEGVGAAKNTTVFKLMHCSRMNAAPGLDIKIWDWESKFPGHSDAYRLARDPAFAVDETNLSPEKFAQKLASEKAGWRAALAQAGEYNATALGIRPGSRGVVTTGGRPKDIEFAIMTAEFVRASGSELPVSFAYMSRQVPTPFLDKLRAYNVTPVDISATVAKLDWGWRETALGAAKVYAMMAAPYEQVVFLDPDVMVLQDPNVFFESPEFRRYGALFWPDFTARRRDGFMWDLFDIEAPQEDRLEFESGMIFVDKSRTWKALKLTEHINAAGRFFFNHFWGDKESFFWGFTATNTPYFLNPHYIHMVGTAVDSAHRRGGARLDEDASEPGGVRVPDESILCGQSMLQLDFNGRPAFMHWNGVKEAYYEGVDPFLVGRTYLVPDKAAQGAPSYAARGNGDVIGEPLVRTGHLDGDGVGVAEAAPYVTFLPLKEVHDLRRCIDLSVRGDLEVVTWNFTETMPGINELFHSVHKTAFKHPFRSIQPQRRPATPLEYHPASRAAGFQRARAQAQALSDAV